MNKFLAKQRNRKGFTIIVLVVVIIVIGILFVAFISKTDNTTDKAKEVGVKSIFRSYQTAAETVMREQSGLKDMTVKEIVDELNRNLDKPLQIRYVEEKHDHLLYTQDEAETAGLAKVSDGYEKLGDGVGKHAATNISCLIDYEDEWNKPYRIVISPANNFIAFYSDGANAVGETSYSSFGYDWTKDMAVTMDYTAGAVGSDAVLINPAVGYNSVAKAYDATLPAEGDDVQTGNFKDWGVGTEYEADEKITTEAATNCDDYMVLIGYNQGVTLTTTEGFSTNQDASNGIVTP